MTRIAKQIVAAPVFQRFILAVVVVAGVLAGLETSNSLMAAYGPLLHYLNLLVLVIFITEITLKLAAHGRKPWLYFHDGWNVFDFAIVALCCLPMDSQFAAVLRLARGLRLLRLVTSLPRLQLLVGALLKSLGAMGYVTLSDDFNQLEQQLAALRAQATKLKRRLAHQPDRTGERPFN